MRLREILFALLIAASSSVGAGYAQVDVQAMYRLQDECNAKQVTSCMTLGRALEKRNKPDDPSKALIFFKMACQQQDADGCNQAGRYYANGLGVEQNYSLSIIYYTSSCIKGNALGCRLEKMVAEERDMARKLASLKQQQAAIAPKLCAASILSPPMNRDACTRACDGGDKDSCTYLQRYR